MKTIYTLLSGPLSRVRHFVSVARELKWHHSLIFNQISILSYTIMQVGMKSKND